MTGRLVVLRHASAGLRTEWSADDEHRPLDPLGVGQAAALVDSFTDLPVDRILTSRYVRCRDTVAALAEARGLPVVDEPWLAEGASRDEVQAGLRQLGPDTLVCTHGDIVMLIGSILAPGGGLGSLAKGASWVMDLADGEVVDLELVPAPPAANQPLRR